MAERHKDRDWSDAPNTFAYGELRVLMDMRDELKELNRLLNCPNALDIPNILRRISRNTHKPKKRKKHA